MARDIKNTSDAMESIENTSGAISSIKNTSDALQSTTNTSDAFTMHLKLQKHWPEIEGRIAAVAKDAGVSPSASSAFTSAPRAMSKGTTCRTVLTRSQALRSLLQIAQEGKDCARGQGRGRFTLRVLRVHIRAPRHEQGDDLERFFSEVYGVFLGALKNVFSSGWRINVFGFWYAFHIFWSKEHFGRF